ncbi:MAG: lipoate--protein ligase family protein [Actinobacteria bacterium]|nr:lipoate--protein ligase family protein [Actinomycetota bacterium]
MSDVRLLDLGRVPAVRSQTVYHAVARALGPDGPDTVILVSPSDPYVCVGFHQDAEQEVDLARCEALGLPVYRREVGGGAVYLDDDQVFVQWVVHPSRVPGRLEDRYAAYIAPLVEAYRDLGIDAYLRPVNDVHVGGRKIGGTGAAQIGDALVLVGSLMLDFDRRTMAEVLKVPSEKMRDKVLESLTEYMVTVADLVDADRAAVVDAYLSRCAKALGGALVPGGLTAEEERIAARLDERFADPAWVLQQRPAKAAGVKIHQDVHVVEGALKTPAGLVRVTARLREGAIDDLALTGDFTILPATAVGDLEAAARGVEPGALEDRFEEVYRTGSVEAPGLAPSDLAAAVAAAVTG